MLFILLIFTSIIIYILHVGLSLRASISEEFVKNFRHLDMQFDSSSDSD